MISKFCPGGETAAPHTFPRPDRLTPNPRRKAQRRFFHADRQIALTLAIIGALNWGGIGLFGFDTVAFLFGGQMALLSRVIYALVGLAGLWCITLLFRSSDEETGHAPHAA